ARDAPAWRRRGRSSTRHARARRADGERDDSSRAPAMEPLARRITSQEICMATTRHRFPKGSCLCGAVRFELAGKLEKQPEACHCSQCRKQTSHFFAAVNVLRTDLTVHGEDKIACY